MIPRYSVNFEILDGVKVLNRLVLTGPRLQIRNSNNLFFTDSGTSSLRLILRNLKTSTDERVLLPLLTCENVAKSVIAEGFQPVFADFDHDKLISTPEMVSLAFNKYKPQIIIPVSMWGLPFDLNQLSNSIPRDKTVILDCALSIGSKINSRPDGCSADHAIYSFGLGKPISLGTGGALKTSYPIRIPLTNPSVKKTSTALLRIILASINKVMHSRMLYGIYYYRLRKQKGTDGGNSINEIQIYPSLIDLILNKNDFLTHRREIGKIKAKKIGSLLDIYGFKYIIPPDNIEWNYWNFPILSPGNIDSEKFVVEAAKCGYEFGKPYRRTAALAKAYWDYFGDCGDVEKYIDRLLLFPDITCLADNDLFNIETIIKRCVMETIYKVGSI
jgi:dTDP-4-amino-4,6-dideoxygalactose transaminase